MNTFRPVVRSPLSRTRTRVRVAALVSGLVLGAAAHAADLLDEVRQRGTLRVAVEGTYPPFNFKDAQGRLTGFDVEIAEGLAARLGVKAAFSTTEWSAILAGLQAGRYDIIVNQVAATDERRKTFDFTQPYVVSSAQLIVRADDTRRLASPEDLRGKRIGVGQGSNYATLARGIPGADVRVYPGAPEYLQDLAANRIDVALNDSLLIPYLAEKTRLPVKAGAPLGPLERNAIPFRKGNPKFAQALDKALADMKADGSVRQISVKWFGRDVSQPPVAP